jgi:hypothetical protein
MTGIYNTRFIYYDKSGKIIEIRPYPPIDNTLFLEIEFSLIEDFLFGNKSNFISKYRIDYFLNLIKGIKNDEEILMGEDNILLYSIPITSSFSNEITLEHKSDSWNLVFRPNIEQKIKLYSNLDFFICKKNDPSFLYSTLNFNVDNLEPIKFVSELEKDLNLISVMTLKKFKSYGIKEYHAKT